MKIGAMLDTDMTAEIVRSVGGACGARNRRCRAVTRISLLALLALLLSPSVHADPPPGYYDPTIGLTGTALRSAIHSVIDDHQRYPYTATGTDTWDILSDADENPANTSQIITVYKRDFLPESSSGADAQWNREHTWPSSYGFTDDGGCNYPFTDCHHLRPADPSYNSARSNRVFDWCASGCESFPVDGMPGETNLGSGFGNNGAWQVWTDKRGDLARAMFYMDVRYEGGIHGQTGCAEPDLILTDNANMIESNTSSNQSVAYMGLLSVLLEWHLQDPVDAAEESRNDVVYSYQGNRNPFVDHPEWVCALWTCADTTPPSAPTGLMASGGDCSVFLDWNNNTEIDTNGYTVYRSATSGGPYNPVSALLATSDFLDTTTANGSSFFYVVTATDTAGNESSISSQVVGAPTGTGGCGMGTTGDPWINELHYDNAGGDTAEGVEIAGPAGLDLGGWLLIAYNGNGGGEYDSLTLSGTLPNQSSGFGTLWFPIVGLQNGAPDGVALIDGSNNVIQFLSYEGTLVAADGAASGISSTPIATSESSATPLGTSMQLIGTGSSYSDFSWQSPITSTAGFPNNGQTFVSNGDTTPPALPTGLVASPSSGSVGLDWNNNGESDLAGYRVYRATTSGGRYSLLTPALVTLSAFIDSSVSNGTTYFYVVTAEDDSGNESSFSAQVTALPDGPSSFSRGDCNADGQSDVSDPIALLHFLFVDGAGVSCLDSCDVNDDTVLGLPDVLELLGFLFNGTAVPAAPFPGCGMDAGGTLGCDGFAPCP